MDLLQTGDRVFHSVYGPGVVSGRATIDRDGQPTDYYTIRLDGQALLQVPVDRAEALGLRLPVNGVDAIAAGLRMPAQPLPDAPLMRVNELRLRWRARQPGVLIQTMRDLLARRLTPSDVRWLNLALERVSAEAAMVDGIEPHQASAAIQEAMGPWKPGSAGISIPPEDRRRAGR